MVRPQSPRGRTVGLHGGRLGAADLRPRTDAPVPRTFHSRGMRTSRSRSPQVCMPLRMFVTAAMACGMLVTAFVNGGVAAMTRCSDTGTILGDHLVGTSHKDVLCGLRGGDLIRGLSGVDVLIGGRGVDDLNGGRSRDVVRGMAGGDILVGGRGRDHVLGGPGGDSISTVDGGGHDSVDAGDGDDYCLADGEDIVLNCEHTTQI